MAPCAAGPCWRRPGCSAPRWPSPPSRSSRSPIQARSSAPAARSSSYWQTDWFGSISLVGDAWTAVGFPAVLTTSAFLQVLCNVLLFVPYGFFLHQVTRWRGLTRRGRGSRDLRVHRDHPGHGVFGLYPCPYRVLDVDDLILNTLGAAVGVLISFAVSGRAWSHPEPVFDLAATHRCRAGSSPPAIDLGLFVFLAGAAKVGVGARGDSTPPQDVVFGAVAAVDLGGRGAAAAPRPRDAGAGNRQHRTHARPRSPTRPRAASSILIRAAVRWAPIVVFGRWGFRGGRRRRARHAAGAQRPTLARGPARPHRRCAPSRRSRGASGSRARRGASGGNMSGRGDPRWRHRAQGPPAAERDGAAARRPRARAGRHLGGRAARHRRARRGRVALHPGRG